MKIVNRKFIWYYRTIKTMKGLCRLYLWLGFLLAPLSFLYGLLFDDVIMFSSVIIWSICFSVLLVIYLSKASYFPGGDDDYFTPY